MIDAYNPRGRYPSENDAYQRKYIYEFMFFQYENRVHLIFFISLILLKNTTYYLHKCVCSGIVVDEVDRLVDMSGEFYANISSFIHVCMTFYTLTTLLCLMNK